jgi:hypothetical protein
MATYTPVLLRTPTAITASAATVYTGANSLGIIRTYQFNTATAHSVSLSIGADAAGTRILDLYLLTTNVPFVQNGWWVVPNAIVVQVKADAITTNAPVFMASGYEYA